MASLVIEYTNLLHAKKSLDDPAVLKFKQEHENDPNFGQQAEVVEWAFRARSTANGVRQETVAQRVTAPAGAG